VKLDRVRNEITRMAIIAQAIRAILLASVIAATLVGAGPARL
jgi:hypothetical protein